MRIFSHLDPSPRVSGERLRHIIKVLAEISECTQVKIIDLKQLVKNTKKEKGRSLHIQIESLVFRFKHVLASSDIKTGCWTPPLEFLTHQYWGEVQEFEFLTHFQVILMLLVHILRAIRLGQLWRKKEDLQFGVIQERWSHQLGPRSDWQGAAQGTAVVTSAMYDLES